MQAGIVFTMGGADGPTAVYTTVMIARPVVITADLCATGTAALGLWLFLRRRKKSAKS